MSRRGQHEALDVRAYAHGRVEEDEVELGGVVPDDLLHLREQVGALRRVAFGLDLGEQRLVVRAQIVGEGRAEIETLRAAEIPEDLRIDLVGAGRRQEHLEVLFAAELELRSRLNLLDGDIDPDRRELVLDDGGDAALDGVARADQQRSLEAVWEGA